ncbi:MAG: DegT/DnrJ/EryC1/StrS aminotransferase family protein [bacterium]
MIPLVRPALPPEAIEAVRRCLSSGWIGYGPASRALEQGFVEGRGGWAVGTSSCTAALFTAGRLLSPKVGDEVIVPALTYVATAMAFKEAGFKVRIADVDPVSLMVTPETAAEQITAKTRAIVVVHLYGQRAETASFRQLCDSRGLVLVEDCAHRLDLLDARGPLGDLACYSFNGVKEAPGGEGGMLWGQHMLDEARARSLSNLGLETDTMTRTSTPVHASEHYSGESGLKLRLNDIAAAIAQTGIDSLAATRARRQEIAHRLDRRLGILEPHVRLLPRGPDDSRLMYVVRVTWGRDRLRAALAKAGIASGLHYDSLSKHPLFAALGKRCPSAEQAASEIVTLPAYPAMSLEEVDTVGAAVCAAVQPARVVA